MSKEVRFIQKYVKDKTVLHIGGHKGQEGEMYKRVAKSFTFVEPHPHFVKVLRNKGYKVLPFAITNKEGLVDFFVTNNSQKSSLKEPTLVDSEHKETIKVRCVPLKDIQRGFDVLVIDAQGETFEVLNSGDLVFDIILCEASTNPRYKGEKNREDIHKLLVSSNYKLINELQHKSKDIYDLVYIKC